MKRSWMRHRWNFIGTRKFFPPVNSLNWWKAAFEWGSVYFCRRIFIVRKMTVSGWYPYTQDSSPVINVEVIVCGFLHVLWDWWRGQSENRHFSYNEIPTSALNTISLKCLLPLSDTIDRREKIHACIWGRLMQARVIEIYQLFVKKVGFFCNRVVYWIKLDIFYNNTIFEVFKFNNNYFIVNKKIISRKSLFKILILGNNENN